MALWFGILVSGLWHVAQEPDILRALLPTYGERTVVMGAHIEL